MQQIITDLIRYNVDLLCRLNRLEQALKIIRAWAATPYAFGDERLAMKHIVDKAKEVLEDGNRNSD